MVRKKLKIGDKFGRLTVIQVDGVPPYICPSTGKPRYKVRVRCECGNIRDVTEMGLRGGYTKSCGCLSADRLRAMRFKHGGTNTRLFHVWSAMRARCYDVKNNRYPNYGARGIRVCRAWRNDFAAFRDWALAHGYTDELTIDRLNLDGNYTPSNCRWATRQQQAYHTTKSRVLTFKGQAKCLAEWAAITGISYSTINTRLRDGWSIDDALTIKAVKGGGHARAVRLAKARDSAAD